MPSRDFVQTYTLGDGISRNLSFKISGKIVTNITLFYSANLTKTY